jgi:hypothetical protein
MLQLSEKWAPLLVSQPETGPGYQVVSVTTRDGSRYDQVVIVGGVVTRIRGLRAIPFSEEQIAEIVVTHDKWDFADRS